MTQAWIDPVIFRLGALQVRWYGLMYVIGFLIAGQLFKKLSREGFLQLTKEKIDQLIIYIFIGMFLGARFAFVFIYNWAEYSQNLWDIVKVWQGGLSYHGAIVGMMVGMYLFALKHKIPWSQVLDSAIIAGTPGVFFGRMGNFINGELYGRVTDQPWGVVFPYGGPYPRHPSQLYEGIGEGLLLFLVFFFMRKKVSKHGLIFSLYLVFYGLIRFTVEFFREADKQLGYYFNESITMGQILCSLMIVSGLLSFFYFKKKAHPVQVKY